MMLEDVRKLLVRQNECAWKPNLVILLDKILLIWAVAEMLKKKREARRLPNSSFSILFLITNNPEISAATQLETAHLFKYYFVHI